jgi:two-component system phosphate regulon sensor histidine kinase PhoR
MEVQAGLPEVLADEKQVEQVLVNILHNAIKFTPPRGSITMPTKAEANNIIVSIAATGVGIPADDLPHIFEPFYKVDRDGLVATPA